MREACNGCGESFKEENLRRCQCGNVYCDRCLAGHLETSGHRLPKGGWTSEATDRLGRYIRKKSVWQTWHLKEQRHALTGLTITPKLKRPAKESFASLVRCSDKPKNLWSVEFDKIADLSAELRCQPCFWADIELFGRPGRPVVRVTLTLEDFAKERSLFSDTAGPWDVGDALGRLVMNKLSDEHGVEINDFAYL